MCKFILLNQTKIIKFAIFIILVFWSLDSYASEKKILSYNYYNILYDETDSILVTKLLAQIKDPLERIENFFGYKPGSVITIYITKSDREYKKYSISRVPEWSQAVAYINERLIILKFASAEEIKKSPQILLHELTHIFISDRLSPDRIPTWLNEGLADYLSGDELTLQDKLLIANALTTRNIIELSSLDSLITFHRPQAQLAYAQALTAVQYCIKMHGEEKLRKLIKNLARYRSLNDAFLATVGYDFIDFEIDWYEDIYKQYRWLIVLNLENLIWISITVLAILAIITIKLRNRKKIRGWEETEQDL